MSQQEGKLLQENEKGWFTTSLKNPLCPELRTERCTWNRSGFAFMPAWPSGRLFDGRVFRGHQQLAEQSYQILTRSSGER